MDDAWKKRFTAPTVQQVHWSPAAPDRLAVVSTESGGAQAWSWDLGTGERRLASTAAWAPRRPSSRPRETAWCGGSTPSATSGADGCARRSTEATPPRCSPTSPMGGPWGCRSCRARSPWPWPMTKSTWSTSRTMASRRASSTGMRNRRAWARSGRRVPGGCPRTARCCVCATPRTATSPALASASWTRTPGTPWARSATTTGRSHRPVGRPSRAISASSSSARRTGSNGRGSGTSAPARWIPSPPTSPARSSWGTGTPGGEALLLQQDHEARNALFRYDLASGELTPVVEPAGTISQASVRPDGAVWYRLESGVDPPRYLDLRGAEVLAIPGAERGPGRPAVRVSLVRQPLGRTDPGMADAARRRRPLPHHRVHPRRARVPQHGRVRCPAAGLRRPRVRRAAGQLPWFDRLRDRVPPATARRHRLPRIRGRERRSRPPRRGRDRRSAAALHRGLVLGRLPRHAERRPASRTLAGRDGRDPGGRLRGQPLRVLRPAARMGSGDAGGQPHGSAGPVPGAQPDDLRGPRERRPCC